MSKSDKIKEIVKGGKPSFGTNPLDPWSAKSGIAESEEAMLKKFLLSRGINPGFVPKDTKIAHSKSGEFKKWKMDHENIGEETSQEHTPTQKRLHVLKKAAHMHKEIRVADGHKKLHSEEIDESYGKRADKLLAHSHDLYSQSRKEADPEKKQHLVKMSSKAHKVFQKARDQHFNRDPQAYKAHVDKVMSGIGQDYKDQEAKRGIGHVRDSVEIQDEPIQEVRMSAAVKLQRALQREREKSERSRRAGEEFMAKKPEEKKPVKEELVNEMDGDGAGRDGSNRKKISSYGNRDRDIPGPDVHHGPKSMMKSKDMSKHALGVLNKSMSKKPMKEDAYQDSQAATQMPFDTGNNPAEAPNNPGLSKKATRVINIFNKKKVVKEELYDQDKDDKPVQTNGKKPKVSKQVDQFGDNSSKAAIVMTGGKTLTGEPRDTIEIDPMLRKPKGGDVNAPATDGKATDKKENK
jgi:hypothetical protein